MTNDPLSQPHDSLAKLFLQYPDVAVNLLQNYLPPDVAALFDFSDFHYKSTVMVDNKLGQQVADFRYATRFKGNGRPALADIYVEHQSTLNKRLLCYRQFRYLAGGMEEHFREIEASESGFGEFTFPFPVSVILYHGGRPWGGVVQMNDLVDQMPGNVRELLYFPVYLIDLSVRKTSELPGKPAVRAFLTALKAAGANRLEGELKNIFVTMNDVHGDERARDWLQALVTYVFGQIDAQPEKIDRMLEEIQENKEATAMATSLMDRLILKGEAKGKAEGKAESLIQFLEKRFGTIAPEIRTKISSCMDTAQLEAWLDTAISARSLAEFTDNAMG